MLDILVQSRRDKHAAKRLLRKLLKKQMCSPDRWNQLVRTISKHVALSSFSAVVTAVPSMRPPPSVSNYSHSQKREWKRNYSPRVVV